MSMDRFWEEVAVKQKNGINRILYAFSWLLIVFSGFIAVFIKNRLVAFVKFWLAVNCHVVVIARIHKIDRLFVPFLVENQITVFVVLVV